MRTTTKKCTHWSFTATRRGRRIHYRCAQPGCRYRWRRTHRTNDRTRGVA